MPRTGRPERPLATTAGSLPQLAAELRRLRGTRTYRELADKTGLSIATLRAAASGERLPTWNVTRVFSAACSGDKDRVRQLWEDASAAAGRPVPAGELPAKPPVPGSGEVTSAAQLVDMMKRLRIWADNPSLAELNKIAGGHNLLPPSTVSDMLRTQRLPRLELVSAFVRACGLDDDQAAAWEQAWAELRERELIPPQHELEPGQPLADVKLREPVRGSAVWAVAADFVGAAAGTFTAVQLRFENDVTGTYIALSLALPVLWIAALRLAGAYDARFIGSGSDEFRKVFNAGLKLLIALVIFSYAVSLGLSRGYLLIALSSITLFDLVARYAIRKRLHASGRYMLSVVAVGDETAVASLVTELRRDQYHGLSVIAACVTRPSECDEVVGVPVYGGLNDVMAAVRHFTADTVVVLACPEMDSIRLRGLAWELEKTGTDLRVSPALLDIAGPRTTVTSTAGLSLLQLDHPQLASGQRIMKGLFDRCAAAAALILFAPLFVALSVAIWIADRGPVLFRQVRVGKDGRVFKIYGFRTMAVDAEQRRVTALGAHLRSLSVDGLPQLLNVIRGDMSLVGPRPALPEEAMEYPDHVRRRLVVKPGLTGLWQLTRRSDLSWDESVRLDLRYVENWSFALDLQILWKTISLWMEE